MTRFTATRATLGAEPIVVLADDAGRCARIACHGAALLSLEVLRHDVPFDVAWGYRTADEIKARAGSHFAVLAPFGGRIADARYRFEDRDHDLQPGVVGAERGFRHGFVRDTDFAIAELAGDATAAAATLTTQAIRPRPGYPFAIDLTLAFALHAGGLDVTFHMRNVGDTAAPCFCGWHAYFRVGAGKADDWNLAIPARTTIATDAKLIALPGTAAYVPLDAAPTLDFRTSRPIGNAVLDNGYADLAADARGHSHTHVGDPSDGFALDVWQERGVMHAFTGDTLGAGARSAVALEPMECMADAFNRAECAAAIRLDAGNERTFRCGVAVA